MKYLHQKLTEKSCNFCQTKHPLTSEYWYAIRQGRFTCKHAQKVRTFKFIEKRKAAQHAG